MSCGSITFEHLLQQGGARPGRGRRWSCPSCPPGKYPSLAVDLLWELAFCHRCHWKASRRSLERYLGIEDRVPTASELRTQATIRWEAGRFAEWIRTERIATAALLRDLGRHEAAWREEGRAELAACKPVSERIWEKLELCVRWQERVEAQWQRLFNFEANAKELYREFSSERETA